MTDQQPNAGSLVVGYLGPEGTFTEQALYTEPDLAQATHVLLPSIHDVLQGVAKGELDRGFLPIENSIEGSVTATLDALSFEHEFMIQREVVIPIAMNLLTVPGTQLDQIKTVGTIPVAAAQCRTFLNTKLNHVEHEITRSTADAARQVAELGDPSIAAIGPARAAEVYGLDILDDQIADRPDNKTRFVTIARGGVPAPTGHDKTTVLVYQRANVPGSLLSILQEFAARAINLHKLESRPTKHALGDYCFLIDFAGHIHDELVSDCLRDLKLKQGDVKFLGSYPAADEYERVDRTWAEQAYTDADTWISNLRSTGPATR